MMKLSSTSEMPCGGLTPPAASAKVGKVTGKSMLIIKAITEAQAIETKYTMMTGVILVLVPLV